MFLFHGFFVFLFFYVVIRLFSKSSRCCQKKDEDEKVGEVKKIKKLKKVKWVVRTRNIM